MRGKPFPNRDVAGRQEASGPLFVDAAPDISIACRKSGRFPQGDGLCQGMPRRASATKRGCISPHSAFSALLPRILRSSFMDVNSSFARQ